MSAFLSTLRLEARRSLALPLFPVILGLAVWFVLITRSFEVFVWLDTTSAIRETVLFFGPLIGGLCAWMAGRESRRKMDEMLRVTPRPPVLRDLATWGGTALWGLAVYAGLTALLFVPTWWNATWGGPPPGYLLVTVLGVVANSAVGYAAGRCLPNRFTAPLVAVGLFMAQILPLTIAPGGLNYELLTPAPNSLIYREVFNSIPPVAGQQSLWLVGLVGISLAAIAIKGLPGSRLAWAALAVSVAVAVAGFAASVGVDRRVTASLSDTVPYEPVCEGGGITVCVHPAHADLLPEFAAAMEEVSGPLVGVPGAPTRVLQMGSNITVPDSMNQRGTTFVSISGPTYMEIGWLESSLAESLVRDMERFYGGPPLPKIEPTAEDKRRCGRLGEDYASMGVGPDEWILDPALESQEVVIGWLLEGSGGSYPSGLSQQQCANTGDLVRRFADLNPEKRKAWLDENFADLRAGKIALKDLP